MALSNKAIQSILNEYGRRVKCLCFDHKSVIMNQPLHQTIPIIRNDDIKFKSVDGSEYIIVPSFETLHNNRTEVIIPTDRLTKIIVTTVETDVIDVYNI